jgi:hypothetical protein
MAVVVEAVPVEVPVVPVSVVVVLAVASVEVPVVAAAVLGPQVTPGPVAICVMPVDSCANAGIASANAAADVKRSFFMFHDPPIGKIRKAASLVIATAGGTPHLYCLFH